MESSNHQLLEDWLSGLTEREHLIFDKGFTAALEAVLEDFTDARIKLLNKIAEVTEEDVYGGEDYMKQLMARVSVLDLYEKYYKKRISILKPSGAALA